MCRPRARGRGLQADRAARPGRLHGRGGHDPRAARDRAEPAVRAVRLEGRDDRRVPRAGIGAARHDNGSPLAKDNNGFISRVKPDGAVENLKFIEGGRNGIVLNAPKGLALAGDTLWVADIDVVRAFNAKTGAAIDSVSLSKLGAVFLNDLVVAPTGAIYITDTGIRFDDVGNVLHPGPDRIFRIAPDRTVTVAVRGDTLGRPNGIALDPVGKRFVIVEFGGRSILAWKPGDRAPSVIAKGPGGFDGVVVAGGKILVSSWTDSTVSSYETGQEVKLITGIAGPADIGYDAKRNRVLIPVFPGNRVEVWQLP
ncbi:MAG: hypothetical protein DMD49_12015 [Gemmatimonadetes bacterium]|nr:MAG: hypothetical protein DMD49_12015 [Gemmatimonadota bacterium]